MLSETEWSGRNKGLLKSRSKFLYLSSRWAGGRLCATEAVNFTRICGVKCQKILYMIILLWEP